MNAVCFICNHPLISIGKIGRYAIFKCQFCGLGTTKNLSKQTGIYHRDESYIKEEKLFENIFMKRVNIILKFKNQGKVMEIGSSTGVMLSLLKKKGWEVIGVEVSEKAARVARKKGLRIIQMPFEEININEKFDLIIFNHTFEHLKNPKEILEKAHSMLAGNGLLYIDLPNFGGITATILGIRWPMLLPSEHLWHFTYKALKLLLTDLGFKIIFVERASGVWDYGNPWKGILVSLLKFKKRFFTESLTAIPSWVVSKVGMGSDLMIIAKKI